jgi:hypothetical protein
MNWSLADQIAYIKDKGTGGSPTTAYSVSIGPAASAISVTYTHPAGPLVFSNPTQLPDPALVSPNDFLVWTRESQIAYIQSKGEGLPVYLGAIAPNGTKAEIVPDGALQLRVGSSTGEAFSVSDAGRAALQSEKDKPPASLDPKIFLAWGPGDRQAYVTRWGTGDPKSVLVGPGTPQIHAVALSNVSVSAGVIQRTSGDYEPKPYHYLSGSAAGTPSPVITTSAEWLFPSLDGEDFKLPVAERPAEFYTAPSSLSSDEAKKAFISSFMGWHSAYQLEYIKTHGTGDPKVFSIFSNGTPSVSLLTAVVSPDDPTRHFIVQSLDKAAIARMTKAEQNAVAGTAAFAAVAASLGLATISTTSLTAYGEGLNGGTYTPYWPKGTFLTPINYINDLIYAVTGTAAPNKPGQLLPTNAQEAFTSQLFILRDQLMGSVIVSPADIKKKVDELRERFDRLFAFFNVKEETDHDKVMGNPANTTVTVYTDVISQKGDLTGINRGYAVFLAQEERIAELAKARTKLVADNGIFNGKNLDVPYLVYKFQSLYNLSLEAEVVAETEQVNQQNDLLKTYAAIQDIINQTLAAFTKADSTTDGVLGKSVDETPSLDADQMKLLSMFENDLGTLQKHPLEVLKSISRPLVSFFKHDTGNDQNYDLEQYTHTQWTAYGTRLSETVTIINQNSQIQMNDINSLDKERNRHFELANNALSKMADIIANISRASG